MTPCLPKALCLQKCLANEEKPKESRTPGRSTHVACHLRSLQIIGFNRFSRLQLFFSLPGGNLLFAEGNAWQQWFRMKSVGFNVLCLSHGLPKAQNSDCLEKTISLQCCIEMPIKQHSEKEEGTRLGKELLGRMQDEMDYLSVGL